MENSSSSSCEKLDGDPTWIGWVGAGVASAFFASLERCGCVNVTDVDDDDEDLEEEAKGRPLMLTEPVNNYESMEGPPKLDATCNPTNRS